MKTSILIRPIRALALLASLLAGAGVSPQAAAGAMFSGFAEGILEITGITTDEFGILAGYGGAPIFVDETALGTGVASATGTVSPPPGTVFSFGDNPLEQIDDVSGMATPVGSAAAKHDTQGEYEILNISGTFVVIDFVLDFTVDVSTSTLLPGETAGATARLIVDTSCALCTFDLFLDLSVGDDGTDFATGLIPFSIEVLPGEVARIRMKTFAQGFADSPPVVSIPGPSSLALLGLGLIGLALARRRRA